jgi:chemotaxis protein CheD
MSAILPLPVEDPLPTIFLKPASLCCAVTPTVITTLLGSCVAVCLWDGAHRIGGMNHFLLPSSAVGDIDPRYGDSAIDQLIAKMLTLGCGRQSIEAKIFGGAEVLAFGEPENNVGNKNVKMALARLDHHAIAVSARRTGGESGLLVRFSTETGHVLVRAISAARNRVKLEEYIFKRV